MTQQDVFIERLSALTAAYEELADVAQGDDLLAIRIAAWGLGIQLREFIGTPATEPKMH